MAASPAGFAFPPIFSFPPFFTLQPVDATRAKQLEQWRQVILSWHRAARSPLMNVKEWPGWSNSAIGRTLSDEGVAAVLEYMVTMGSGEWDDAGHARFKVYLKTPAELAAALYDAIITRGMATPGNIYTLYELHAGGALEGTEFHGMDAGTLMKAVQVLERSGQAETIPGSTLDEAGIKFMERR